MAIVWTSARTRLRLFRLSGVKVGTAIIVWTSFARWLSTVVWGS
jgi:hypothetical protein